MIRRSQDDINGNELFRPIAVTCGLLIWIATALAGQTTEALVRKAETFHIQKPDSCLYYANRALAAAGPGTPDSLVTKALFFKGWNLNILGRYSEAIEAFHALLKHPGLKDSGAMYIRAVGHIGTSWRDLGRFDSAMVYLQRYETLVDKYFGTTATEAKLELGELYRAMGRMDESNAYKLEAIHRARKSGNQFERITALYYYLDDNAAHLSEPRFSEYLNEFLDLTANQQKDGTVDYTHAGMLLMHFQGKDKLRFLESAVASFDTAESSKAMMFLIHELDDEYRIRNKLSDAERMAQKGLRIAYQRDEMPFVLSFQQDLYRIAAEAGKYDSAFRYLMDYHDLKDSLSSALVQANVDSLKIKFETARKEHQISTQKLQIQQRTNQRNLLLGGIAVVVCFGALGVFFFWNRNRMTTKLALQESHIKEQRIQQLEQEKQLLAMTSMLEGQETERVRIATDLHDGLGGLLGTIRARLSIIQEKLAGSNASKVAGQVNDLIDTASHEVRRISHNMAPHALRLSGLHDAIRDLVGQMKTPGLVVEFQWFGPEDRMPERTEIMLYRVIQELTNNVRKYARASYLLVQVNRHEDELSLVVEDDGRGFDLQKVQQNGGLGLRSVQSRVDFLKGTMDIDTRPGDGTSVSVRIPLGVI